MPSSSVVLTTSCPYGYALRPNCVMTGSESLSDAWYLVPYKQRALARNEQRPAVATRAASIIFVQHTKDLVLVTIAVSEASHAATCTEYCAQYLAQVCRLRGRLVRFAQLNAAQQLPAFASHCGRFTCHTSLFAHKCLDELLYTYRCT